MSNGEKILVVDDDTMMLDFALRILTSLGYRTIAAMDAESALRVVRQDHQIRGAMIDLRLGNGPHGARLAQELLAVCPDLRVLLTSGAHGSLQAAGLEMPGHVKLLSKPYRRKDLAECLSRLW